MKKIILNLLFWKYSSLIVFLFIVNISYYYLKKQYNNISIHCMSNCTELLHYNNKNKILQQRSVLFSDFLGW